MNPFLPSIFPYLSGLLLLTGIVYAIGLLFSCYIIVGNDNTNPTLRVLNSLMVGLSIAIPLFAIIWTRGNSIMLLSIVLWVGYVIWSRFQKQVVMDSFAYGKKDLKSLLFFIIVLIPSFFVFYYLFFIRSGGEMFGDQVFYGNLACWLMENHTETSQILSVSHGATMYHWGDIWTTVAISTICHLKPIYALCLITYPFFMSICVMFVINIIQTVIPTFSLLSAVIIGVCLLFYTPIVSTVIQLGTPIFGSPKFFLITCFLFWGCVHFINKSNGLGVLAILHIVPFYSVISPGVLVLAFIVGAYFSNKEAWLRRFFNPISIGSVIVGLLFGLFYFVQLTDSTSIVFLYDGNPLINALLFGLKRSVRFILILSPILILLFIANKRNIDSRISTFFHFGIFIIVSGIISAIVGGVAKQVMLDGGQITTNFCDTSSVVFVFVGVVLALSSFSINNMLSVIVTILFVLIAPLLYWLCGSKYCYPKNPFDESEVIKYSRLKQELKGQDAIRCGYFRNYQIEGNLNTQMTRINMFFPMHKLVHILPCGYYYPYCLSVLNRPTDIDPIWNDLRSSQLFKYKMQLQKDGVSGSNEEYIKSFMQKNNVDYIIVENGSCLPPFISNASCITIINGDTLFHVKYD